ncbi:protein of unknown function [Aminobacter niigataensis]|nr:protein of unknown function [Aminobacter niigataensis]
MTATRPRGDKAGDENVFRHFRHLHYWLAFALVRTFSPHLHTRQVKRPGQQARGVLCLIQ